MTQQQCRSVPFAIVIFSKKSVVAIPYQITDFHETSLKCRGAYQSSVPSVNFTLTEKCLFGNGISMTIPTLSVFMNFDHCFGSSFTIIPGVTSLFFILPLFVVSRKLAGELVTYIKFTISDCAPHFKVLKDFSYVDKNPLERTFCILQSFFMQIINRVS